MNNNVRTVSLLGDEIDIGLIYCNEYKQPKVVRVIPDSWPDIREYNSLPEKIFNKMIQAWTQKTKVDYLITPGGFLHFDWPQDFVVKDIKSPTKNEIQVLIRSAQRIIDTFLLTFDEPFAKIIDTITLGIDSESELSGQQAELIFVKNFKTGKIWWTGKSYPTMNQQDNLVCLDFESHFFTNNDDQLMVLGCHDLNLFSNRALANTALGSWRNRRIVHFQELAESIRPTVVLQHAHTADTPRTWSTAWSGIREGLPEVETYAGSGRWFNPFGSQRGSLMQTLRSTSRGRVSTFYVEINTDLEGIEPSKLKKKKKYVAPKFR